MGFPHTLNVAAAITVEEYLRGTGDHTVTETAEAAYDLVGYVGYVTLGSATPAMITETAGHPTASTNAQLADAVKALRESHDPNAPQKQLPPGTTKAKALGDNIPPWLKPLLLKLLTDLLMGALGS